MDRQRGLCFWIRSIPIWFYLVRSLGHSNNYGSSGLISLLRIYFRFVSEIDHNTLYHLIFLLAVFFLKKIHLESWQIVFVISYRLIIVSKTDVSMELSLIVKFAVWHLDVSDHNLNVDMFFIPWVTNCLTRVLCWLRRSCQLTCCVNSEFQRKCWVFAGYMEQRSFQTSDQCRPFHVTDLILCTCFTSSLDIGGILITFSCKNCRRRKCDVVAIWLKRTRWVIARSTYYTRCNTSRTLSLSHCRLDSALSSIIRSVYPNVPNIAWVRGLEIWV